MPVEYSVGGRRDKDGVSAQEVYIRDRSVMALQTALQFSALYSVYIDDGRHVVVHAHSKIASPVADLYSAYASERLETRLQNCHFCDLENTDYVFEQSVHSKPVWRQFKLLYRLLCVQ